ncbi:threonine--tRNA ligase 2 [Oceanobacillus oncorhynchi subsp. incaldanensis]|uniref:Threonine--tRNA ligase n=1 Tax=Oceanobacillus oncorhynchi TaxID=545501 RepID=A0A0A1MUA8_9BACI|nr:threonine--tRNA ligase [Oceanobacillus oncorhynchi]GIO17729.1 threonine--tRNA ligase 2 [Oceanobacillus oncorhynchi subsp. incaldanensis]CEI83112.1 Threonine--tRNA ligase 2 [Oceanobacillus oncorhynchi]
MKNEVKIRFPDGREDDVEKGVFLKEIAEQISKGLAKKAVAGKVNGKLVDVSYPISEESAIELLTLDSDEGLEVMRHTAAHILAQAVERLYGKGNVQFGIGPVIEHGFYYDMKCQESITQADLMKIEKEMQKIIQENLSIHSYELSLEEAKAYFKKHHQSYKVELLESIPADEAITIYEQGDFSDLCRGPHLPSTGYVKAFHLIKLAGAYWRGDSNNEMLQRIYGIAFAKKKDVEAHLHFIEEAEKRDHRKLGKQLDLFMFSEEAPGMPFYLPNGQIIRQELEQFSREAQLKAGYQEVRTPLLMNQQLWEESGHWDHYQENMYFSEVDHTNFALKPMNCPGHMLIYKQKLRSYRDLPIRLSEFGQVHRHEYSGALNGLLRVRTFCQDDAHIFAREDQVEAEMERAIRLIDEIYGVFGFSYAVELSTRPEKSMGEDAAWEASEQALENVLERMELPYQVNEGDGAFYGSKIDFHIKDALGRSHQCATLQLDFQMPEKFDLTYVNAENEKLRPVVIHRAIYGSIDRFFGILLEHFAGAFPVWLAPVQAIILPVSSAHHSYANQLMDTFKETGIRIEADYREEKLGLKLREAQMKKIPYIFVVGDEEKENEAINVRKYGEKQSQSSPASDVRKRLEKEIAEKHVSF